jgi:hypothetical protein
MRESRLLVAAAVSIGLLLGVGAYGGLRYNKANGTLVGIPGEVGADRWQVAGGWFVTPNVLMKAEYVTQEYNGFPLSNIRHGGKFHGVMLEGVIGF